MEVYDSIQGMVVWETIEGHRFNQTLLVNWIDPENSSSMSDQRLKFVGTTGRYEGDQKARGVRLLYDDKALEERNPDFCNPYQTTDGFLAWEGYGIESTVNFLKDVEKITAGKFKPQDLEGNRPTFAESVFSTSVIEAAEVSLKNNSDWIVI